MPRLQFLLLATIASVVLLGTVACQMFDHDMQALRAFAAAYEQFDQRVSDVSGRFTEANQHAADQALADLTFRASMQLSSLMKNDGSMMRVARQVSDAATMELATLKASQRFAAEHQGDSAALLKQFEATRRARRSAYAHFERLLAAPPNSQ
jgi:hypothetical protein